MDRSRRLDQATVQHPLADHMAVVGDRTMEAHRTTVDMHLGTREDWALATIHVDLLCL